MLLFLGLWFESGKIVVWMLYWILESVEILPVRFASPPHFLNLVTLWERRGSHSDSFETARPILHQPWPKMSAVPRYQSVGERGRHDRLLSCVWPCLDLVEQHGAITTLVPSGTRWGTLDTTWWLTKSSWDRSTCGIIPYRQSGRSSKNDFRGAWHWTEVSQTSSLILRLIQKMKVAQQQAAFTRRSLVWSPT